MLVASHNLVSCATFIFQTSPSCDFITDGFRDYDGTYECGHFSMTKTEDGVQCTAAGCSYGGQRFDVSFEAGSDALAQLQAIIAEADVASCNGINVQTMGGRNAEALSA